MNCRLRFFLCISFLTVSLAIQSPAIGEITFVDTSFSTFTDAVTLQRVGVNRGGTQYAYRGSDWITGSVTAVNISSATVISADGYPSAGAVDGFLSSPVLNRGLLDPGLGDGVFNPGDEFTQYTFNQPVYNDVGSDLLLSFITFDFGSFETSPGPYWLSADGGAPLMVNRSADFDLSPVNSMPMFTYFDTIADPSDFLNSTTPSGFLGTSNATPRPSLQLVDLTDLGIGHGGTITSLRIWDDDFSNGNTIYPTFIAAFPAVSVPEPSFAGALAICISAAMTRRKRRQTTR
ncbi:hypothetical protein [Rubripirellula reticaptiva]|uniref:PEP-CTERM protein-sorting domain-containing protein n=1 Tax=Rubripirellula reticaptiva TaxID=2528013 RepID=A0A5C6EWS5_9BACT|nr:hypothetical protein [Rubripirellula reticaptiva]TWU51691.1 hypothetical protein Poly59_32860 [Rubripirellula reticaptiva]